MKKLFILFTMVLSCVVGFAQTVTLTFTGRDANNHFLPFNRVLIVNVTQGWQETIYYPDTILILGGTGIEENIFAKSFVLAQNNPNPFEVTTRATLTTSEAGEVQMEMLDMNGHMMASQKFGDIQAGVHQFVLTVAAPGTYILTARQNGKTSSIKMVNNGKGPMNRVEYAGVSGMKIGISQQGTGSKGSTGNPFNLGDEMIYIGFANVNGTEHTSQTIHNHQIVSENFVLNFNITASSGGQPCPGTPTVIDYDGNMYNTVQIGQQCWMKENLRTTHYADGLEISQGNGRYYPNGDVNNVSFYGYLYTWDAVMHGENSSNANPSGVQGICPAGWHVPSEAEWTQLGVYMIGQSQFRCGDEILYCAKSLADIIGWSNSSVNCAVGNNPTANNLAGFGARPAGRREFSGYGEFGTDADFWTSTMDNSDNFYTWSRNITYDCADIKLTNDAKSFGRSVRCLLNQTETPIQQDSVSDTSGDAQPCTGTPTVIDYDGNVYNTVQIGEQCWMKENLRTTHFADGVEIPAGNSASTTVAYRYNPNNSASTVSSYGYLYNWPAVMHGANCSVNNPSGVQGICPTGWHVPSNAEWTQLTDYLSRHSIYVCGDNIGNIAKSLSATEGWSSIGNFCAVGNGQGSNNSTGFNARPAGFYKNPYPSNGNHFGRCANFWTTTEINQLYAWHSRIGYVGNDVFVSYTSKHSGFSVRCLRD